MNLRFTNFSLVVTLLFGFLVGCYGSIGELARSPDGNAHVYINGEGAPGYHKAYLEIQAKSFYRKRVDISAVRSPFRYEVFWGSNQVGILICNGIGEMRLNIDLVKGNYLPFDQVQSELVSQIVQKYQPTNTEMAKFGPDPLKWFCGDVNARRLPSYSTSADGEGN